MTNRKINAVLSYREIKAVLNAIGQMTNGNARDIDEMMLCGMTKDEALALLSAEAVLKRAIQRHHLETA